MLADITQPRKHPGVAKFGIALEWGSRGRWFESSHSDQSMIIRTQFSKWEKCSDLSYLLTISYKQQKGRGKIPALKYLGGVCALVSFPLGKFPLPFLALEKRLDLFRRPLADS